MNWDFTRKHDYLKAVWETLQQAVQAHDHPLRTAGLGTSCHTDSGTPAECRLRTVVLREVQPGQRCLIFHTDIRSPKCRDIRAHPVVQWLFYDPRHKIQIRAVAKARIHHKDDRALSAWQRTPLPSRVNYGTALPPGSPLSHPDKAWRPEASPQNLTVAASERGRENFALVATFVDELELLKLSPEGHRRVRFRWRNNRLTSSWLVP